MARAVWTGTISFGLVSVPVRLYPATRRKDVRFHEIDRVSGQRVRHQKVIEATGPTLTLPRERGRELPPQWEERVPPTAVPEKTAARLVAPGDVVKGFEVARDRYVTVDREELEELVPERTRAVDVEQFDDASAVDPIYFDVSYYAVPDRYYERAYGLLDLMSVMGASVEHARQPSNGRGKPAAKRNRKCAWGLSLPLGARGGRRRPRCRRSTDRAGRRGDRKSAGPRG